MKSEIKLKNKFIEKKIFKGRYYPEVGFVNSCIDLIVENTSSIYAIEFKIGRAPIALKQARNHGLAAEYVYICIAGAISDDVLVAADSMGVGVIQYDMKSERFVTLLKGRRNKPGLKYKIRVRLRERSQCS